MKIENKDEIRRHVRALKSIQMLKKFFRSKTDTYFPANKLLKAVLYHEPPLDLIQSILNLDPYASHPMLCSRTKTETTALQIAIQHGASVAVIDELIKANPYTLFVRNHKFDPFTYAKIWRNNDSELIESLQRAIQLWDVFDHGEHNSIIDQINEGKRKQNYSNLKEKNEKVHDHVELSPHYDEHEYAVEGDKDIKMPFGELTSLVEKNRFLSCEKNQRGKSENLAGSTSLPEDVLSIQQQVTTRVTEYICCSIQQLLHKPDTLMFRNGERSIMLHAKQAHSFVLPRKIKKSMKRKKSWSKLSSKDDNWFEIPMKDILT